MKKWMKIVGTFAVCLMLFGFFWSNRINGDTVGNRIVSSEADPVTAHIEPSGTGRIVAWDYSNTLKLYDKLNSMGANQSFTINLGPAGTWGITAPVNAKLKQEANYVTDNGFGLVIQLSNNSTITDYWCNDSWGSTTSAVNVPQAPENWDSGHVKHFAQLGNISQSFYGGWSCDYAGTANGAAWAGVGKGHK